MNRRSARKGIPDSRTKAEDAFAFPRLITMASDDDAFHPCTTCEAVRMDADGLGTNTTSAEAGMDISGPEGDEEYGRTERRPEKHKIDTGIYPIKNYIWYTRSFRSQVLKEMKNLGHTIYILALFTVAILTIAFVGWNGRSYYTSSEEHLSNLKADLDAKKSNLQVELEMLRQGLGTSGKSEEQIKAELSDMDRNASYYTNWKPAGSIGHGLGIIGSAMMIGGVIMYSSRKRVKALRQAGKLKHWLEFHIFLCLLGPTLVLYHTTFKFGGLVSVSFWSMVAVVLSGVVGRYIYTQIPRGISGNALSMDDLQKENADYEQALRSDFNLDDETLSMINSVSRSEFGKKKTKDLEALFTLIRDDFSRRTHLRVLRKRLIALGLPHDRIHAIVVIAKKKSMLLRKIAFLATAERLFHYWHVVHQPFSIIMFVILIVHVVVTVSLGYRWLF